MPMYDHRNFDKSDIPAWMKRETRDIVGGAILLGWKMHISSSESVTIISPCERKKYHFSTSGRSSNSPGRIRKDIIKFADPERLLIADSLAGIEDRGIAGMMAVMVTPTDEAIVDHRPGLEEQARADEARKEAARENARALTRKPTPAVMPKKDGSESEPTPGNRGEGIGPVIVSESPMLAKASEGKGYQSKIAVERHWSDGSVDYKCVECDYSSEKRLAIRGHYGSHKKPKQPIGQTFQAEVPNAATYKPRKDRVQALAAHLLEALESGKTIEQIADEVALTALTWVHEQSRKGTRLAEEHEPRTAEETLERIKSLLDDGTFIEQRERITALEMRAAQAEEFGLEMQEKAEAAEAAAAEAQDTLNSFIELANGLRKDSA